MIHTIIRAERREAPRNTAIAIDASTRDAKGAVIAAATQLHDMGTKITDQANIVYAAEWDGVSPYVIVLKGDIASIKMAYAGWPMIDKAAWDLLHPPSR
jgi:hypothetical protein